MKVEFKTIEFHENYLDEDVLSIITIDKNLVSRRNSEYDYLKNPNSYYLDESLRESNLDDIYGSMNVLIYLDDVEIGAMDCYTLKDKKLFLDKIEILDKGKGHGTIVFDKLKKYFDTIIIEQAIPTAIPFYEKNNFQSETIHSGNKFLTMRWSKNILE